MDKYIPTNEQSQWKPPLGQWPCPPKIIRRRDKDFIKARQITTNAKFKFKGLKQLIQKKMHQDYNKYINCIIIPDD